MFICEFFTGVSERQLIIIKKKSAFGPLERCPSSLRGRSKWINFLLCNSHIRPAQRAIWVHTVLIKHNKDLKKIILNLLLNRGVIQLTLGVSSLARAKFEPQPWKCHSQDWDFVSSSTSEILATNSKYTISPSPPLKQELTHYIDLKSG